MEPDSITHYGVKGMKWGVRRSQAQLDAAAKRRSNKNKKKASSKAAKKARKNATTRLENTGTGRSARVNYDPRKAGFNSRGNLETNNRAEAVKIQNQVNKATAKTMSDADLRASINRMQMERQYLQMTNLPQVETGTQRAGKILLKSGSQVVGNAGKQVATQLVKQEMEKLVGLR